MYKRFLTLALSLLALPTLASAHEVYLLTQETIDQAVHTPSPNPVLAYFGNEGHFYFWGFVAIILTLTVFFASTFRRIEAWTVPFFALLKRFAHPLVRITIGATLVGFGVNAILYGPEVPLNAIFGIAAPMMQVLMIAIGAGIVIGFQTRLLSAFALGIYLYATTALGFYALTYLQHAAGYLFLIIVGGGLWTIDHRFHLGWHIRKQLEHFAPYAFPLLRVGLGASIMFAAFYAKFLHSNLALDLISHYHLETIFPFDPLFTVLGAFIIEFLAGLMLVLGIEIRWTALFLLVWLTLAHLYFPEPWWVHISLYGLGLAIFCHGYDRFAIEGRFLKHRNMEPVL